MSEGVDYCGPVKTIHKVFFWICSKNQRKSVQEGHILLGKLLQELLGVDHSFGLDTSTVLRISLVLFIRRGL